MLGGRDPCLIRRRGKRTRAGCIQRSIVAASCTDRGWENISGRVKGVVRRYGSVT